MDKSTMRRRVFILIFSAVGVVILCLITWFYLEVEEDTRRWNELCDPHRGWGSTTIDFKVLDKDSNKPLDSVKLIIRYGASGDRIADTLLRQEGTIRYTFLIPQVDECESYWAEMSHPQYAETLYQPNDTLRSIALINGKINEQTVYLKPATHIKVRVYNKPVDFAGDTLRLFVSRKEEPNAIWSYLLRVIFKREPGPVITSALKAATRIGSCGFISMIIVRIQH